MKNQDNVIKVNVRRNEKSVTIKIPHASSTEKKNWWDIIKENFLPGLCLLIIGSIILQYIIVPAIFPPKLDFVIYPRYQGQYDLLLDKGKLETSTGEQIELCMANIGDMASGHITVQSTNPYLSINVINFNNLDPKGMTSNCTSGIIKKIDCDHRLGGCGLTEYKTGKQQLELEINCEVCKEPITKEINICIWEKSGAECD
ncbi:hypothetical protein KKF81_06875 [Candidatus Micrarchaeota archaeon]|nr:hypothetical protein [Candidatus Micrarchaeota archaeon]MBU1166653.1 hypothetical protein [Candidatus Micrarchaeota archaeon]MBU1886610.1 hypothetical protein [Candidatus Micrarchaeota archaeon]